eukprot:7315016-Prymnesium_polylepis.1
MDCGGTGGTQWDREGPGGTGAGPGGRANQASRSCRLALSVDCGPIRGIAPAFKKVLLNWYPMINWGSEQGSLLIGARLGTIQAI